MPKRIPTKLRWTLGIAAALAILVIGFYQITARSGARASKSAVSDYERAGGSLDFDSLLPAPIPDSQNYAAIPALFGITAEPTSEPLIAALSLENVFHDGSGEFYPAQLKDREMQYPLTRLTSGKVFASGSPTDLRTWASALVSKPDEKAIGWDQTDDGGRII